MSIGTSIARRIHFSFIILAVLSLSFFGTVDRVAAAGTTRYVATTGSDTSNNCASSASPCLTIQNAVNQSHATNVDIIKVAQGTYAYAGTGLDPCDTFLMTQSAVVCFVNKNLTILGGYTTSNWTTADPDTNLTVIDGANTYRGVTVIGFSYTESFLTMEGFTIQNGRSQGPTYGGDPSAQGGGMWVQIAAVTLRDMVFRDNQAIGQNTVSGAGGAGTGAGLRIESSPAGKSSLLERVTFDSNESYGGTGSTRGGLAFGALFIFESTVTVRDSIFRDNVARAGNSTGSGWDGSLAADALGGALAYEQDSGDPGVYPLVLDGLTVTGNAATGGNATTNAGGGYGAGIYAENSSSVTITDSYVANNVSTAGNAATGGFGAGGGILTINSPATIARVQVINNSAIGGNGTGPAGPAGGGGMYLWRSNANITANATVTNAIIADNYATMGTTGTGNYALGGGGGGMLVQGLTATITHTTFAQNRLGPALVSGQAVVVLASPGSFGPTLHATANINKSIIADHIAGGTGAVAVLVQSSNTVNFNGGLYSGNTKNTNSDNSPSAVGTITGSATMESAASAGFVSPGSPDYNYHIESDSSARDRATGSSTTNDIDEQSRPYDGVSDFGADEQRPTFDDVPESHQYWQDIEILYGNGLTAGCSTTPFNFCPDDIMDRAQSGVFMLRGNYGTGYTAPSAPWDTFADDWSPGAWAERWAEGMYDAGLTAGCQTNPELLYCPWDQTPKVQAAVFGLKLKYGNTYVPPAATGTVFADMTDTNYYGTKWAEQAYADGLLPNCGIDGGSGLPNFCPNDLVSRGFGAYIIVRAKNLTMP